MGVAPETDLIRRKDTQFPLRMFVYFMLRIDLLLSSFRANMCTTERENKNTENGGKHNDKI